jgi:hypothetical protein
MMLTIASHQCEWLVSLALAMFFLTYSVDFWPAHKKAEKGLTEKGDMVYDPALAEANGEGHRPMAPYAVARDMGPNHEPAAYNNMMADTHASNTQAAPSLNQQPMQESRHGAAY